MSSSKPNDEGEVSAARESAKEARKRSRGWLRTLLSGRPHFIIGKLGSPYLYRWFLIPRNNRFNVYLHKFLRDDDDRALHDHPWWFVSMILWGRWYTEVTDRARIGRFPWIPAFRPAEWRHRVELPRDAEGNPTPVWTLIITGRKRRTWGFWCPKGFVPWYDFVDDGGGGVGQGCGDE